MVRLNIKLTSIMNSIIVASYQELRSIPVVVGYYAREPPFMATWYDARKKQYIVEANPVIKEAPIDAKVACIAHELSHVAMDLLLGTKPGETFDLANKNEYYRRLDERGADLDIVLRGYGPHQLVFLDFAEKKLPNKKNKWHHGLSRVEIEAIIGQRELPSPQL